VITRDIKKHNASEDSSSDTKVNGYPPGSSDAEASSKQKKKQKKRHERKRVSKEVTDYLPNEPNQSHTKLNIQWEAEVVVHHPRQKQWRAH
jgi:hypothetical protein